MKRLFAGLTVALLLCGSGWSQDTEPSAPAVKEQGTQTQEEASPAASEEEGDADHAPDVGDAIVEIELVLTEDEAAILAAVDSYAEQFNKGDAKALAAHWTETGEFITPAGEVLKGREALEEDFAAYFQEKPGVKLELLETQIKMLSPHVASETGIARVIAEGELPTETSYEAIHVKTAEGWRIDSVKEDAPPETAPSHYEQLQALEWMIGTWVDSADEGTSIETTGRWTTNNNFIVRTFRVLIEEQVDFEGTQVVGWDPSTGAIRSWTFDSDGGFGVGRWSNAGNRWTVQALNVLPDGRRGSSTNIYDLMDEDTIEFKSIGRQVDGELLPSIGTFTIVRAAE
ncbi:SgcJ/EcaC family oxidoreductase [Bremerella sp. JC770]|uniref:YybH family protein n=1 Tax=Bremerella sp. JC770 TaxID=3232137 RepID=UPI0034598820